MWTYNYTNCNTNILCHHGVKGMKWGIRKYQNPDGSITKEGKARYYDSNGKFNKKLYKQDRKEDGENVIQMGICSIKGIGEKAAMFIEQERKKNGKFKSYDDFYDRCKSRLVTTRVISLLKEAGALEFKRSIYLNRVKKYNIALYSRGI